MDIMREHILKIKTPLIGGELKKKSCCQPTTFQMIGKRTSSPSLPSQESRRACYPHPPSARFPGTEAARLLSTGPSGRAEATPPGRRCLPLVGPLGQRLAFFLKHIMTAVLTHNSQTCGSPVAVCRPVVVSGFAETCSHQHGQV